MWLVLNMLKKVSCLQPVLKRREGEMAWKVYLSLVWDFLLVIDYSSGLEQTLALHLHLSFSSPIWCKQISPKITGSMQKINLCTSSLLLGWFCLSPMVILWLGEILFYFFLLQPPLADVFEWNAQPGREAGFLPNPSEVNGREFIVLHVVGGDLLHWGCASPSFHCTLLPQTWREGRLLPHLFPVP